MLIISVLLSPHSLLHPLPPTGEVSFLGTETVSYPFSTEGSCVVIQYIRNPETGFETFGVWHKLGEPTSGILKMK